MTIIFFLTVILQLHSVILFYELTDFPILSIKAFDSLAICHKVNTEGGFVKISHFKCWLADLWKIQERKTIVIYR